MPKKIKMTAFEDPMQRAFGQIWVAQNMFHVFPTDKGLLDFILQTLRILPGVKDCGMCINGVIAPVYRGTDKECAVCLEFNCFSGGNYQQPCRLSQRQNVWVLPLDTADQRYGFAQIIPEDPEYFDHVKPLLLNFFNSVALTLENRSQRRLLEKTNEALFKHTEYLDHLVAERTAELKVKNAQLEAELEQRRCVEEELKHHRDNLEELVRERTAQLEAFHQKLAHAENLASLGKLTGSIAHEFNNPIYGLRNILEQTLEEGHFSAEIGNLLKLGIKECNRVVGLVRKLRDFYKPPMEENPAPLDMHHVIDDMALLTRREFISRKITLVNQYAPELPKVIAVEDQMKQLVLNLLQNAAEALDNSGGTITISTETCGSAVKIIIQDTGEGIPEKDMQLIFEPFFSTRAIKGTGLGLSVCYGIVKAHGGEIQVNSKVGEGSTFTVILPINHNNGRPRTP